MSAQSNSESEDSICRHKCDTCNRTFWGVYCIQKHVQIHTAHQVYACSVCTKTFISESILERHKAKKHNLNDKQLVEWPLANDFEYEADKNMVSEEISQSIEVKIECNDAIFLQSNKTNERYEEFFSDSQQFDSLKGQHEGLSNMSISSNRNECETNNLIIVKSYNEESCRSRFKQRIDPQQSNEEIMESISNLDLDHQYLGDVRPGNVEMNRDNSLSENRKEKSNTKRQLNKGSKINYCDTCGQSFRGKNEKWIKEHYLNQHKTKKLYHCSICGNGFSFSSGLSKHLRCVHKINGEIQKARCDVCNKLFADKSNLKEHMHVHFGNVKDALFTCSVCAGAFNNRSALRRHRDIHLPDKERRGRFWSCNFCDKTFSNRYRKEEHVANMHTGEKDHVCSVCGKAYYLAYDLKRHMNIHTGEFSDKNTCHICNAKFSRTFTLRRHLKSHMEEGTRFECLVCNKTFSRLWTLQRHTMIHDGTEPFICSVCGDKFIFKNLLTEHMLDQHCAKSDQYNCHVCGRSYNTQRKLNVHLIQHDKQTYKGKNGLTSSRKFPCKHKSRVCETCGLVAKDVTTMEQHRKTHTDQRPHTCPVCDKGFLLLSTMQTHLKIHTGENFHSCTICNKYYTREIDLENHLRGKIHARKILKREKLLQKQERKREKLLQKQSKKSKMF